MVPSKSVYPASFSVSYGDDGAETYATIPPQYVLPSNDALSSGTAYASHDSSRGWTPIGQTPRAGGGSIFVEQDSPPYSNAHLPYLTSTMGRAPTVTSDGASYFPTMTALSSSLPSASSGNDRLLPKPQQTHTTSLPHGVGGDVLPVTSYGPSQSIGYKSLHHSWSSEDSSPTGCQHPDRAGGASAPTLMAAPPSKGTSAPAQDSAQAFVPISMSPATSTSTVASLSYPASLPNPATAQGGYSSTTGSTFPAAASNEALLPSHSSSSNLYSFGSEGGSYKRNSHGDSSGGDGTLVSGQQYTRLRQPQPQSVPSLEALRRRSSIDPRPEAPQRSTVGSYRT
ncbi:MAG: hypothetical protein M1832_000997 [Thelocarpon impressellum]|nr:MAG: hypothetical protein M1832_000997 [Thelocarpon impressellum]